ncbi:pumilio homolog 6, chloroplastic [Olea europaea subsp. europaea]|uniref:Pumilio homolog 6, chloroplastic n=1 Tax=Olea europaea subsp. europaea TaxID=158383 RepID=A0A8S0PI03_OLEEU|nr:pumilio homolog 6, chloroplastic [Olea europaea subsp. europaea]
MATESLIRGLEGTDNWLSHKQSTRYGPAPANTAIEDLGLFLKGERFQGLGKDMIPHRSESAPPSMEGSIAALENIFSWRTSTLNPGLVHSSISADNSETEGKYFAESTSFSKYSSNVKLDPKFGQPINSRERRLFHHSNSTSSDWKMSSNDDSMLLPMGNLPAHEEEPEDDRSSEVSGSLSVERAVLLGHHEDTFDLTQEDPHSTSLPACNQYCSSSHESMEKAVELEADSVSTSTSAANASCADDTRQVSQCSPFTSPVSSPPLIDDTRGTLIRPSILKTHLNTVNLDSKDDLLTTGVSDLDVALIKSGVEGVNLSSASSSDYNKIQHNVQVFSSNNMLQQQSFSQQGNTSRVQGSQSQISYPGLIRAYSSNHIQYGSSSISPAEVQPILQSSGFTPPLYASAASFMTAPNQFYPSLQPGGYFTSQHGVGGYTFHPAVLPSFLARSAPHGAVPLPNTVFPASGVPEGGSVHGYDMQHPEKFYGQVGFSMQPPLSDPFHMQYIRQPMRDSYGVYGHFGHPTPRDGAIVSQGNACDPKSGPEHVAYSSNQRFLHPSSADYNSLNPRRGSTPSHFSFGSHINVGPLMQFPTSPVISPVLSGTPVGGNTFSGGRNNMSLSQASCGNAGNSFGLHSPIDEDTISFSFLEELKSGKGQRYKLSDITGRIAEVSVDQHGSRFIQQKLENCSAEEKESLFREVVPHASKLMTDVFGNYVIQKLFEYGTLKQRKDLANQLTDQVLPLSLQMYGCRVIQKALEVIELEQKAKLVRELDGHVMRCVRDQNGNHVIQKCIESIPASDIGFIISSFRGQVATLSMHPYGCRVIQRVLEHCNDQLQTQFIVDEILESVCTLIQDQYGNYVTQVDFVCFFNLC